MTTENMNSFLENATRILFFTGKGGVGKTSLACAASVSMAQQGTEGAAGQHGPGIEPRRGSGCPAVRCADRDSRRRRTVRAEHRSGSGREGLPGSGDRAVPRSAPRSLPQQHGRAAIRRMHGRDRRFRRIHQTAWRCPGDRGIRSHHLRHGSDGTYASLVEASGRMDGIHRREHDRHLVPWATGRPRNSEIPLRLQPAGSHRRINDNAGSGKPSRALLTRRSESNKGGTGGNGYRQSATVSQRRLCCAGSQRCRRVRTRSPRPGSTRRDACRARETSANRGSAAPIRSDGRGEPPECVRRHVADSQGGAQRPVRRDPFRASRFRP